MAKYSLETLEKRRLHSAEYRKLNPEKHKLYSANRKEKYNSDPDVREKSAARFREKMKDPNFRKENVARATANKMLNRERAACTQMLCSARRRARNVGVPFDLDDHKPGLLERVSMMRCELSGIELAVGSNGIMWFNSPTLDRIEPAKGYVYSNVRIIAFCLNAAFSHWGQSNFATVVRAWIEHDPTMRDIGWVPASTAQSPWEQLLRRAVQQGVE
jgi:hypothetical protein